MWKLRTLCSTKCFILNGISLSPSAGRQAIKLFIQPALMSFNGNSRQLRLAGDKTYLSCKHLPNSWDKVCYQCTDDLTASLTNITGTSWAIKTGVEIKYQAVRNKTTCPASYRDIKKCNNKSTFLCWTSIRSDFQHFNSIIVQLSGRSFLHVFPHCCRRRMRRWRRSGLCYSPHISISSTPSHLQQFFR